MENFKNMQELMTHLVNGGAMTNLDDSCPDTWVSLYNGQMTFSDGVILEELRGFKNWRPVPQSLIINLVHKLQKRA